MGVSGFFTFFNDIVKTTSLKKAKGKWIVIDANLLLYKYIIGIRKGGEDIITSNGYNVSHIYVIGRFITILLKRGIQSIWVFDGKEINKDKIKTIKERQRKREITEKICKLMKERGETETETYRRNFKNSFHMTSTIIKESKLLLKLMGIPYITSLGEADPQCAGIAIEQQSKIFGVYTEDSDIIVFGAPRIIKNINWKDNTVSKIDLNDILESLKRRSENIRKKNNLKYIKFKFENFIDFMSILGNDYCEGIKSIDRRELFEIFCICNYNIPKLYIKMKDINKNIPEQLNWEGSSNYYKHANINEPSNIDLKMLIPQINDLISFLNLKGIEERFIKDLSNNINNAYYLYKNIIE